MYKLIPQNPNDLWIIHREEVETTQDGVCDVYVILDAVSKHCLGMNTSKDLPTIAKTIELLQNAIQKYSESPKSIAILKADPLAEITQAVCNDLKISFQTLTKKEITPLVSEFAESFKQFKNQSKNPPPEYDEVSREEAEAFIPETYGPCPCASGNKYKFCCQKIFRDIVMAMCEAQEGKLDKALFYMKEAESKVGSTAEVNSRLGIVWSFFDKQKANEYFQAALKVNPNHPRTNYVLGIEASEKKKYKLAIEHYQKALEHYPVEDKFHHNETLNNLGNIYFKLKDFKAAKDAWVKALVLLPTDRMVIGNLFNCIYENPEVPTDIRTMSSFIQKFLR